MTSEHEIGHLAKRSLVDADTLRSFGRRLPEHHSLVIGKATGGYPMVFAVDPHGGVEISHASSAFSPAEPRSEPRRRAIAPSSSAGQTSAAGNPSLPLFPDEPAAGPAAAESAQDEPVSQTSQAPTPTIAQITGLWDRIVARVARRRRILETILSAARPLRVVEQTLFLGFPPQHRFQQELVESEEYRSLLQEELRKTFGVSLEVTTEVYPA
jgi:hypothetical protein